MFAIPYLSKTQESDFERFRNVTQNSTVGFEETPVGKKYETVTSWEVFPHDTL